jgi:hypothetical protein
MAQTLHPDVHIELRGGQGGLEYRIAEPAVGSLGPPSDQSAPAVVPALLLGSSATRTVPALYATAGKRNRW